MDSLLLKQKAKWRLLEQIRHPMKFECGPDYVGLAKLCVLESLREVVLSLPDGADMATDG